MGLTSRLSIISCPADPSLTQEDSRRRPAWTADIIVGLIGALGAKAVNKCAINSTATEICHKRFGERPAGRSEFKAAQRVCRSGESVNPNEKDLRRLI